MPRPVHPRDQFASQLRSAELYYRHHVSNGNKRTGLVIKHAIEAAYTEKPNTDFIKAIKYMRHLPVTVDEFLMSGEFLGGDTGEPLFELWPALREEAREICPDLMIGEKPIHLVLNGGATGTGKSFLMMLYIMYSMYFLTCFRTPQLLFTGLNRFTPIVFMLQSVSRSTTNRVLYKPIRDIFTNMRYFKKFVDFDKHKEGELHFHDNLQLTPVLASPTAMIGQAIIALGIDEASFMAVVENSKQVSGPDGLGGYYNQVEQVYQVGTRRRKGRFLTRGPSPGGIYMSSSVNYTGDFLETEMAQAENRRARGDDTIRVLRHMQFQVQPQEKYTGERFRFLVGTNDYGAKVLEPDAVRGITFPFDGQVVNVPTEYISEFENDPEGSQRDVLGIASSAINRFISQVEKITAARDRGVGVAGLKQLVRNPNVVLARDGLPTFIAENMPKDKDTPRFVHVDLSRNKDRCGIAMCRVRRFVEVGADGGNKETLPVFDVEMAISIKPSAVAEIDISDIRSWVLKLKLLFGLNIYRVTYDGFDSHESVQILRKAGVKSDHQSVDKTTEPYETLKRALYQDRVNMIENELLRVELATLQMNQATDKIDHPPKGTKDVADAVCGAIFSANRARSTRAGFRVSPAVVEENGVEVTVIEEPKVTVRKVGAEFELPESLKPKEEPPKAKMYGPTGRRTRHSLTRRT